MALDPTISLGVKSFSPDPQMIQNYAMNNMKMAQIGQQMAQSRQAVEASKAEQANTEAQNPGFVAQSQSAAAKAQLDQQDAAAMEYAKTIAPKYTTHNPNGTMTFNALAAGNDMAMNGFVKQGGAYVKSFADGVSADADATKKLQDNTGDLNKIQLQMAGPILNAAAQESNPEKRAALLDKGLAGAEASYPQLFPKGTTSYLETLFNRAKVDPKGAAGFAVTPDKWIQLGNETTNAESNRIASNASAVNASTQALAQKIGVVGAVNSAATDTSIYNNGTQAIQNLRSKDGKLPEGYLSVTGENLLLKMQKDPAMAATLGALQRAEQVDGQKIDLSGGLEGVQQQIRLLSQAKQDAAARLITTQDAGGRSVPTAAPTTPTTGTRPANPGGTQRMSKDGQSYDIPIEKVNAAKAAGYK